MVCLVTMVDGLHIFSRVLTTQQILIFDINTGKLHEDRYQNTYDADSDCAIQSVQPLPVDIHNTLLQFDRRNRLENGETQPMTDEEKNALLFLDDFYASNPIPLD